MTVSSINPYCFRCKHFSQGSDEKGKSKCQAFPDGIPFDMCIEPGHHTKPFPGDNGILFEPRDDLKK